MEKMKLKRREELLYIFKELYKRNKITRDEYDKAIRLVMARKPA